MTTVIPAKAGIQSIRSGIGMESERKLDARLRGHDGAEKVMRNQR